MKKIIAVLGGTLLASSMAQINAVPLDSFGEANYFYANPSEYTIGEDNTVEVVFNLDNVGANFNSFMLDLYLPEGFSIKKDNYGYYADVNAGRGKKTFDHSLTIAYHEDENFYRILGASLSANVITTGDDWIFNLTIEAPEDYSPIRTAYKAKVTDVKIADLEKQHLLSDFSFTIICGDQEEPSYADSKIERYINLSSGQTYDFVAELAGETATSWTSSNTDIVNVSDDGTATANAFGHAYIVAKDAEGNEIAVFSVFVCPTVTIQHPDGVIYSHHVLYNTRPTLNVAPAKGYFLVGVTHDGTPVEDQLVDNNGKYVPEAPIIKNTTINLALERDTSGDPTVGSSSVWSESQIRIYVDGHRITITGAEPNTRVVMTNIPGKVLFDENMFWGDYNTVNVIDSGIYIITIGNEVFKVLVP